MPSASDLVFLGLLFTLSCSVLASRLLGDAGIGWHIRNGQLMLQNHAITRTDPFSSSMSGQPWYAWEWLYDLLIAGVHHAMGLNGVVFLTALVIAATFALTLRVIVARGGNLPLTIGLLALALGASAIHLLARPHVVSWLLTVVWFAVLDSWESEASRNRNLLWLPVLMMVWVNLHGGFLTGFVLLGIYLTAGLMEYAVAGGEIARLKNLAGVTLLSLIATFVNPYGYKLHEHIYHYLTNHFLMNHIEEFRAPDFHGGSPQCFLVLIILAIVAFAVSMEKPRATQVLVIIFAVASGVYSARNLPVSSILLTLAIAPVLSRTIADAEARPEWAAWLRRWLLRWDAFASRMRQMELAVHGHLWPIAGIVLAALICMHDGKLGAAQLMDAQFPATRFPVAAVDLLAHENNQDPVFCPDYWGGYLIYRLYPQSKVIVDDRHDFYGEPFLKQYLKAVRVEEGWREVLDQGRVNIVLVPSASPLAQILRQTLGWTVQYSDKVGTLLKRTTPLLPQRNG
jgi:hypothetical protein